MTLHFAAAGVIAALSVAAVPAMAATNFVASGLDEWEDHAQQTGKPGMNSASSFHWGGTP